MTDTKQHFKNLGRMLSRFADEDPREIARLKRQTRDKREFGAVIIGLDQTGRVVVAGCRPDNVRKKRHKYQLSDTVLRYVPDAIIARRLAAQVRKVIAGDHSAADALRALDTVAAKLGVTLHTKPLREPTRQDWFEAQRYTP